MTKRAVLRVAAGLTTLFSAVPTAHAQVYATGQSVFASPSGTSNDWYSGCIVGSGRSNSSYQVECGGVTYWISGDHISLSAPAPGPDPMYSGRTLTPVITPSHVNSRGVAATPGGVAPRVGSGRSAAVTSEYVGVISAAEMHRRIEQDKVDAKSARLAVGKYSCYSGGQYTFSDLFIIGPHTYRVEPGGSGVFNYTAGALTFTSGPYAGAYSRMVDARTVGISAKGNTNLGTQCGLTR